MKMFLLSCLLIIPLIGYSQNNLIIKGAAPLLIDGSEIRLSRFVPRKYQDKQVITSIVKDHKFQFFLNTNGSTLYVLSNDKGSSRLFLSPGKATILVNDTAIRNLSVTDNATFLDYQKYQSSLDTITQYQRYSDARSDYYNYIRNNHNIDTSILNNKIRKRDSVLICLNNQLLATSVKWIRQHPNSPINSYVLYDQIGYMPENDFKKAFYLFSSSHMSDIWAQESKYRIDSLFIGGTAPSISETDINGKIVRLNSFRGKYVLIDFWASWCVPCRVENPNIVKVEKKFKSRNFMVVSISLDDNKEVWLKAIKTDKLDWTHLSALKGWDDTISEKYYIASIPANYLIDPDGKIIAKNLRGEELIKRLDDLLIR